MFEPEIRSLTTKVLEDTLLEEVLERRCEPRIGTRVPQQIVEGVVVQSKKGGGAHGLERSGSGPIEGKSELAHNTSLTDADVGGFRPSSAAQIRSRYNPDLAL
jgi:hypothetical protein